MKRLTIASVAVYLAFHLVLAAAYVAAWLTDFEQES